MKRTRWSTRIILRYILFQIPGFVLIMTTLILFRRWVDLPGWVFWGSIVLWIAKDIILFPFVWRSYDQDRLKDLQTLIGGEGIVEKPLEPSGYIRVHGELWQAEVGEDRLPVGKGEVVKVIGIRGLKLIVEPYKMKGKTKKNNGL